MIVEDINNFAEQFYFIPEIKNGEKIKNFKKIIVVGMGGSHLAADLIKWRDPSIDLLIHKNYGLPAIPDEDLAESLIICSSYSGNTEEVVDALHIAVAKGLNFIVVASSGALLEMAKANNLPYVELPKKDIQPRMALGYNLIAIAKIIKKEDFLRELRELASLLDCKYCEGQGKDLAVRLEGKIPIVYASAQNKAIACNWKIKFNENAKIPAFYNVFPELNHNEMTGFDLAPATKNINEKFHFIFIKDKQDDERILKRMNVCENLYEQLGYKVEKIEMKSDNLWKKAFESLIIADWTSYWLAKIYNVEPEKVPMVEEFKRMMRP